VFHRFIIFGETRNRQTICLEPKPVKRKTACKPIINSSKNIFYPSSLALNIASQAKLNFDFHQLSLLFQKGVVDENLSGQFFTQKISSPQTTLKVLCIDLLIELHTTHPHFFRFLRQFWILKRSNTPLCY
jgi:hypothetical protein